MMSSLSYDITQRSLVISYRRFGTAGPTGCPRTSVITNQRCGDVPEERKPHLHRDGSLKQNHIWLERIHQPQIRTDAVGTVSRLGSRILRDQLEAPQAMGNFLNVN